MYLLCGKGYDKDTSVLQFYYFTWRVAHTEVVHCAIIFLSSFLISKMIGTQPFFVHIQIRPLTNTVGPTLIRVFYKSGLGRAPLCLWESVSGCVPIIVDLLTTLTNLMVQLEIVRTRKHYLMIGVPTLTLLYGNIGRSNQGGSRFSAVANCAQSENICSCNIISGIIDVRSFLSLNSSCLCLVSLSNVDTQMWQNMRW